MSRPKKGLQGRIVRPGRGTPGTNIDWVRLGSLADA